MSDFSMVTFKPVTPADQAVFASFEILEAYLQGLKEEIAALENQVAIPPSVTTKMLMASKFYEEGSYQGAWTGFSPSPGTPTVSYVRIGKVVHLRIPSVSGTSNATTFTLTGMPASIRPLSSFTGVAIASAQDNGGLGLPIWGQIATNGTIFFAWNGDTSGWTASGTKGFVLNVFTSYTLQ